MHNLNLLAFAISLSLTACSSSSSSEIGRTDPVPEASAGSSGGDGGSGTAGAAGDAFAGSGGDAGASFVCTGENILLYGVPYKKEEDCIDTERPEVIACGGTDAAQSVAQYFCVRRKSDGTEFWSNTMRNILLDEQQWETCDPALTTLPVACATRSCAESPQSSDSPVMQPSTTTTCSPEATKDWFQCGLLNSPWDENCCRRQECTSNSDCAEGQTCAAIGVRVWYYCWLTDQTACDCGGTLGGPTLSFCF